MTVVFGENSQVVVTVTADELGTIRYTLNEGCIKLRSTALYFKNVKDTEARSAKVTADLADSVLENIEAAVRLALYGAGK